MPTAYDLLLHLRCRVPHLARRLDAIRSLGCRNGVLTVLVPEDSWCLDELCRHQGELQREAERVFGHLVRLEIDLAPAAPQALPLPVMSSKYWNHVAFVAATPDGVGAVVVPKPQYLDRWLDTLAAGGTPDPTADSAGRGVRVLRHPGGETQATAETPMVIALPDLLDELAALARAERSYVQLVTAFPGDPAADRLESRLYAVKEWGTPRTPGPILQKYVGRIHYSGPDQPILGMRLAERVAAA